jgi:predicted CopG family antitoxin
VLKKLTPITKRYNIDTYSIRMNEVNMHRKLTITLDEEVYKGLHTVIGSGKISQFIENLVKPHVIHTDLAAAYKEMAEDEEHERQALEWSEGIIGDNTHEER